MDTMCHCYFVVIDIMCHSDKLFIKPNRSLLSLADPLTYVAKINFANLFP